MVFSSMSLELPGEQFVSAIANRRNMTGIKKNEDFSRVYRRGTSKADHLLVLYRLDRGDSGDRRIGISVSKKTGNSVVRHRIKRRIKEIFRLNEGEFSTGCDYVAVARKGAASADYREIAESLIRLNSKFS